MSVETEAAALPTPHCYQNTWLTKNLKFVIHYMRSTGTVATRNMFRNISSTVCSCLSLLIRNVMGIFISPGLRIIISGPDKKIILTATLTYSLEETHFLRPPYLSIQS